MGVAIFPGGLKNIPFWRVLKAAGINPVARWLHWWEMPEFIATPVIVRDLPRQFSRIALTATIQCFVECR